MLIVRIALLPRVLSRACALPRCAAAGSIAPLVSSSPYRNGVISARIINNL